MARFMKPATPDGQVQQRWHCEKCGYETEHEGGRRTQQSKFGVSRVHICSKCGNKLETMEVRRDLFNTMRIALMEARQSTLKLLAKIEQARETVETPESHEPPPNPPGRRHVPSKPPPQGRILAT